MNRSITATHRYRWSLPITGTPADDATYETRAQIALKAITEDVQAMTVVIPFPGGLRFMSPVDDGRPTRVSVAALSTNLALAAVASEPCDPWPTAWPAELAF